MTSQLYLIETKHGITLTPRLIFNSQILGVCDVTVDEVGATLRFRRNETGYQAVEFTGEELAHFTGNLRSGQTATLQGLRLGSCQHSWPIERSRVVDVYELSSGSQKVEFANLTEACGVSL